MKDYTQQWQIDNLRARTWAVERSLEPWLRGQSGEELDALDQARARADSAAGHVGLKTTGPLPGETSLAYRKRLLATFAPHTAKFKGKRFDSLDASNVEAIEELVYADAVAVAHDPATVPPGHLRMHQHRDAANRLITTYTGDPYCWLAPFSLPGATGTINLNPPAKAR